MKQFSHANPISRRGMSLFEVVLALGIFLGAVAAISQILQTGSRAAVRAQLEAQAVFLCERRLNEVLSGVQPLEAVSNESFEGDDKWTWSLNIEDSGIVNLLKLHVSVEHKGKAAADTISYHLNRYLRDPQVYLDAAADAAAMEESP